MPRAGVSNFKFPKTQLLSVRTKMSSCVTRDCVTKDQFKQFFDEHRSFQSNQVKQYRELADELQNTIVKQTTIMQRLSEDLIEQSRRSNKLAKKLLIYDAKILALENRIDHLESNRTRSESRNNNIDNQPKTSSNIAHVIPDDPCEILVTGVAGSLSQSPIDLAKRLLMFIGLSSAISYVFFTRSWNHQCQKSNSSQGFVIKFTSPIVRNEVLRKMRSLNNMDCRSIFGTVCGNRVRVADLLCKPTYLLLRKARKMYKVLNCTPPLVKNGIIYMKKNNDTTLFPILTEDDLTKLSLST